MILLQSYKNEAKKPLKFKKWYLRIKRCVYLHSGIHIQKIHMEGNLVYLKNAGDETENEKRGVFMLSISIKEVLLLFFLDGVKRQRESIVGIVISVCCF